MMISKYVVKPASNSRGISNRMGPSGIICACFRPPGVHAGQNGGVRHGVHPGPAEVVPDDAFSEFAPFELAVRFEVVRTEQFPERSPARMSRLDDLARHFVRVDDKRPQLGEHARHKALPCGDSTGEGDFSRHRTLSSGGWSAEPYSAQSTSPRGRLKV